ncbi:hypothetical protein KCU78_g10918, partial [Aureobasidium melanogenum]
MESARNKMQKVLQFASEHRQRILRISYITLVLPIFIVTIIPLVSPILLKLPNADVVQFQLSRPSATMDVGYHSICLNHVNQNVTNPYNHPYLYSCVSTVGRHVTGEKLAQRWRHANAIKPAGYGHLVQDFRMALHFQRETFYPGLLIAATVFWVLSVGLFATTSLVNRSIKPWLLRVYKGSAVIGSILIIVGSIATTASVYALIQYIDCSNSRIDNGRMGAILAVQWAAAAAMSVHALLAFAVAEDVRDQSEGSIRLDN